MSLATEFSELIRACFSGIWIVSEESDESKLEIARLCREEQWQLATWDIDAGLQSTHRGDEPDPSATNDPLSAIRGLEELAAPDSVAILLLENFHRFLQSAEIVQAISRQIQIGKQQRTFLVILAPLVDLPRELEKKFIVLEHQLPTRDQLLTIAHEIASEPGELPAGIEQTKVLDAAAGLTRYEAEGAFSLSLIRDECLQPETIWRLKGQQLKKSGLLTLDEGQQRFADLGGLEALKAFCLQALRPQEETDKHPAKGVLLLSPPGCGKSAFCKALGNETGRPTLRLDIGTLMGSLVGQSEANVRRAIAIAEAMAPCVLMIDEIDKGLSGIGSSGQSDSGVSARLFGTLLTWLADRTSDVFVVATANSVEHLPPEFTRAERFDGVFFVDLPGRQEKETIWQLHRQTFQIRETETPPADDQWTGAEIRACCRLAALLEVPLAKAAELIVPVAVSSTESITKLRQWASGRCLSADRAGIYRTATTQPAQRRGIRIDPSNN